MSYKIDIKNLDNDFAIVQKATNLKFEEAKISFAEDNSKSLVQEIDNLLCIKKLKHNGNVNDLDSILELPVKQIEYTKNKKLIELNSWESTVIRSRRYLIEKNINPETLNTYSMLSKSELQKIQKDLYHPFEELQWEPLDYVFVGLAGIIGILTDFILVKIPNNSLVTEKIREFKMPLDWQDKIEKFGKVPFDNTGGQFHRLDTFGHDPILGFIFGTLDIITGKSTSAKVGNFAISSTNFSPELNPIIAILKEFSHLLSDFGGKLGLPPPFFTFLRLMKFGSFKSPNIANGHDFDLSNMVQWMYSQGYDLRHFITMGITPASIEIFLRAYILIKNYCENKEIKFKLANNPKYRSMLLTAHAIACAGNAGKIIMMEGNPLAFNYAEWMALVRYLLPSIKYWLIDKHRIKFDNFIKVNSDGWGSILNEKDLEIDSKYFDGIKPIYLGVS